MLSHQSILHQLAEVLWQGLAQAFHRAVAQVALDCVKDRAGHKFRILDIQGRAATHLAADLREELVLAAFPGGLAVGFPSLEVKSTYQHGQLRAEGRSVFHGQAVAKGMEDAAQGRVGQMAVVFSELKHQVIEPFVGDLYRIVKGWQTSLCHGWTPFLLSRPILFTRTFPILFTARQGPFFLKIVFQNEHFVVIDKPHGMLTVPARTGDADPRACAGRLLETMTGGQIFPVHRLDFEVGGLVIFARNATSHREASRWFEKHLVQKTYEAVATRQNGATFVETVTAPDRPLIWEAKLVRGKKRAFEAAHGKESLTRAWFVENLVLSGTEAELWRLEPVTGRSHQLRWEMQRHGRPILGDILYGGNPLPRQNTIALRAVQILFSPDVDFVRFGLPADGFACESVVEWIDSSQT